MKKILTLAAAALISASAFAASSNTVTSANVVGYVKKGTPAEGYAIQSAPFLGTNQVLISELFTNTMPLNTKIYVYNDSGYSIETYKEIVGPPPDFVTTTNWSPNTTLVDGTAGFWVGLPSGSVNTTNIFSGDVVNKPVSITVRPGFNLIAIPYSASVVWTNTALAQNANIGDKVYQWSNASQTYSVINQYKAITGPPPDFTTSTNWTDLDMVLDIGEGFWYDSSATTTNTIVETIPYSL